MNKHELKKNGHWRDSLQYYLLSDLGMELDGRISLPRVFQRAAQYFGDATALMEKRNGAYHPLSFKEILEDSLAFASALLRNNFQLHDKVALLLKNSPVWVKTDFGCMFAGGTTVPIYDTLNPATIRFILENSQASILVLEDEKQFQKFKEIEKDLPHLKKVLVRNSDGIPVQGKVAAFEGFLAAGRTPSNRDEASILPRLDQVKRDHVASIVYTSGTTGEPKGVMLTHRNFLSNVYGVVSVANLDCRDIFLSILPLSHTFERTVGYYVPLLTGATIAYAEGIEQISQNLQEVRPTICCAVPRVFEKLHHKMELAIEKAPSLQKKLFSWALKVGDRGWRRAENKTHSFGKDQRVRHRPEDLWTTPLEEIENSSFYLTKAIAHLLVYRRILKKLGGRIRYFISGGAPLSPEVTDFFRNLQIKIFEGYGLTETSPIISFNFQNKFRSGTVGKLLPYVQIKLSEQGEILVKGPNVMAGYYQNPQATAEAIDGDGWFHTGDVGHWDENHYLKITDRIKELIVLSTGKNVAPLLIERKLGAFPEIAQAVVIGNNRKYVSALIFPNLAAFPDWNPSLEKISDGNSDGNSDGIPGEVREKFEEILSQVNAELSHFEQIKKFEIMPYNLAKDSELLTPTLKIKRRKVEEKFKKLIEGMYR